MQSGHENEKVLEKMRELMKQMIYCYSASKTFPYIMEGLRSRNNRTRTVCGDLVGFLLDNHYVEVMESQSNGMDPYIPLSCLVDLKE